MENQSKSIALQWLVPTLGLMIAVIIMMISFSNKSSASARDTVYKELSSATEEYGEKFVSELKVLEKVSEPIAALIDRDNGANIEKLVAITAQHSDAAEVYYCDADGVGLNQSGIEISIGNTSYFQAVLDSESVAYIYVPGEEYGAGDAVAVVTPVDGQNGESFLFLFYPLSEFADIMSRSDFDSDAFLAILDSQGNVLAQAGGNSAFIKDGNLIEALTTENADTARVIKSRIGNSTRGTSRVTAEGEEKTLSYVPLGVNHWEIVLGVSNDYVEKRADFQWKKTKSMLNQLIAVIFIFLAIVVVINIASKIRNKEQKRQLENKADTDLLTGLNNKLATERKIKDYMLQNPDTQSMMFLLDIDNFKKINDTMGHAFGDEVLRSLGKQIGVVFRASDIIGRIGGDEFMIFLKGINDDKAICAEAKKVEDFFHDFKAGEYVKYAATASIGVAIYPQEGADFETLYKAADQGLYKAKKRGKNQLAFYREEWVQNRQMEIG